MCVRPNSNSRVKLQCLGVFSQDKAFVLRSENRRARYKDDQRALHVGARALSNDFYCIQKRTHMIKKINFGGLIVRARSCARGNRIPTQQTSKNMQKLQYHGVLGRSARASASANF